MRRLAALAAALICLWLLCPGALAVEELVDDLPLDGWEESAKQSGLDLNIRQLLVDLCTQPEQVDWEGMLTQAAQQIRTQLTSLIPTLFYLLGPALLCALNRRLLNGELAGAAQLVCLLGEAQALLSLFARELTAARGAVERIGGLTEQVYPVLLSLLSMTGGSASTGLLKPLYAFLSGAFSSVIHQGAFLLTSCAAVLAVAGHLSPGIRLSRLFRLMKSGCSYLVGGCMTAFLGILGVSGLLGATRDGVSVRAAKYAVDNLLPVVGGEVAGAMDAMVMSAALVKNAVGVTGLILLLGVCLGPLVRLMTCMLMCRLAGALIEPLDSGEISACLEDFSAVMQMLLIALCACIVLFIILVGAAIRTGGAVFAFR